jgi:hypothetical protein
MASATAMHHSTPFTDSKSQKAGEIQLKQIFFALGYMWPNKLTVNENLNTPYEN